jgi:type II secretory pathway pseudopilin PulG
MKSNRQTKGRKRKIHVRLTAFTLVELMVVIMVIIILVALLVPVIGQAYEYTNQTACRANLADIGKALRLYAESRFSSNTRFPDNGGSYTKTDDWQKYFWHADGGNAGNFWILVREGFASPNNFICPSTLDIASENDPETTNGFGEGACSYGLQSQWDASSWTYNNTFQPNYASNNTARFTPITPIAADQNPRYNLSTDTTYANIENSSPDDYRNHLFMGMNVLRMNLGVTWETSDTLSVTRYNGSVQNDDIYLPSGSSPEFGRAGTNGDIFIIP